MPDKRIYVNSATEPEMVLIRATDGYVWDEVTDSAWEVFADASWSDYLISNATRIGTTFPLWYFDLSTLSAALTAGQYIGWIFDATGSGVGDTPDKIIDIPWNGNEIMTGLRLNQLFGGIEVTVAAGSTATTINITTPTGVDDDYLTGALCLPLQHATNQSWVRITSATGSGVNWTITVTPALATGPNTGEKLLIGPLYQ